MNIEAMPQIIMEEDIVFSKLLIPHHSRYQFGNRNRIEDYPKRIDCALKFKITELLTHILGKARTQRNYFRRITYRISRFFNWNLGSEVHFFVLGIQKYKMISKLASLSNYKLIQSKHKLSVYLFSTFDIQNFYIS